ncbi:hypothetical protein OIO90_004297 [Microbotryomycetes sp. JL221]|nr:hypothetical protein OIO90_004297 [Microbotryomycetes sp. JL221]
MSTLLSSGLSLPPATRALTLLLITCSTLLFVTRVAQSPRDVKQALGASEGMVSWLVVTPGNVMWYPWTLFTSAFVENNLIQFIFSLMTLPLAGRYLERVWGQFEFLKFVVVVVVASNVITCIVSYVEAVVLGNPTLFLYGMDYHGQMALQTGFLVAFTQLIPEHQVQVLGGLFKMRVKSLPMLYVTVSNIACLIGYQSPWILIQFGWLVSWFYLRFIKINEGGEFRGDRSETFAFASWFPPFAQKYVAKLSNFVFGLAVRFKILTPWSDIESSGSNYTAIPGGARAEAERRRALALKALDQRMAQKPSPNPTNFNGTGSTSTNMVSAPSTGNITTSTPTAAAVVRQPSVTGATSVFEGKGEDIAMSTLNESTTTTNATSVPTDSTTGDKNLSSTNA